MNKLVLFILLIFICSQVTALTLTTFNDSSSSKNYRYTGVGVYNYTWINLPANVEIITANIVVGGDYYNNVSGRTGCTKSCASVTGDSGNCASTTADDNNYVYDEDDSWNGGNTVTITMADCVYGCSADRCFNATDSDVILKVITGDGSAAGSIRSTSLITMESMTSNTEYTEASFNSNWNNIKTSSTFTMSQVDFTFPESNRGIYIDYFNQFKTYRDDWLPDNVVIVGDDEILYSNTSNWYTTNTINLTTRLINFYDVCPTDNCSYEINITGEVGDIDIDSVYIEYNLQQFPTFSISINNTVPKINDTILYQINVTENTDLSNIIFSWNCTGGVWINTSIDVSGIFYSMNITKDLINTSDITECAYQIFANDSYNNNNQTDEIIIIITKTIPIVKIDIIGKPLNENEDLNVSLTFFDADDDTWQESQIIWYIDDNITIDYENLTTIGFGNTTANEIWIASARVFDGFNWSDWVNDTVTIGDVTPPNATNFTTSSTSVYISDTITFYATVIDSISTVSANACIFQFYKSDLGIPRFNVTNTDTKVNDTVSRTLSMSSYGTGVLVWEYAYCSDDSGNTNTSAVDINIIISADPTPSAPSSGGSGTPTVQKKDCNFEVKPKELEFFQNTLVLKVDLKNGEDTSVIPSYTISNDNFEVRGATAIIAGNSEQEISVLRNYRGLESIESQLIITFDVCQSITIPITYNPVVKQFNFLEIMGNFGSNTIKALTAKIPILSLNIPFYIFTILIIGGAVLLLRFANASIMVKVISGIFIILFVNVLLSFVIVPQSAFAITDINSTVSEPVVNQENILTDNTFLVGLIIAFIVILFTVFVVIMRKR